VTLVLDSGAVTFFALRRRAALPLVLDLRAQGLWPPSVPVVVLAECLHGHAGLDASVNAWLKTCDVIEDLPEALARRAAQLRRLARAGSAVDALVVAAAEPSGVVLTSDPRDLMALATYARDVRVEVV
jgi:hypothetical protein